MPGRFTGAVFVAGERLDAGSDTAQAKLVNLFHGGALITSWAEATGRM